MTRKEETRMKMQLYKTSTKEVCSKREPISPVTEYGARPKHLTNSRIGFKTVKVSAGTAVILLHEEPSPILKSPLAEELVQVTIRQAQRDNGIRAARWYLLQNSNSSFLPLTYISHALEVICFFQIKLMFPYLSCYVYARHKTMLFLLT
jgi:hypothetical protein